MASYSFAGIKSELAMGFKIIQDTIDPAVDKGKCKISGVALYEDKVVPNALVYSQHTRGVRTNENGEFVIVLDTADQYLTIDMGEKKQGYIENYKFKGGHAIKCEVYIRDWDMMMIVDKPVIYLYSDDDLEARVQLKTDLELTFTYPMLEDDSWSVNVTSNGLGSNNGRVYPYLFWEAKTEVLDYQRNDDALVGELILKDTVISYLESKLSNFGLNSTEQTDFITYWGPKMSNYEYVITQFNLDEVVEEMAALDVSPIPESKRRVFMLFTGFDYKPSIELENPASNLKSFNRTGFTLLEWGGTEVSKEKLLKTL